MPADNPSVPDSPIKTDLMANDPAFLFYPGDYLRDTQCLSEKSQVAYDRIMCEHMRNICISQDRLDFFTKRLSEIEKQELAHVLSSVEGGFAITWVAESICKRKDYSASRRKNREGKSKKDISKISSSYDSHMENEIENENVIVNKPEGGTGEISEPSYGDERLLIPQMLDRWKKEMPEYPDDPMLDGTALYAIAKFLCKRGNLRGAPERYVEQVLEAWEQLCSFIANDRFYKQKSLKTISNCIQEILQKALHGDQSKPTPKTSGDNKLDNDKLQEAVRRRTGGG